MVDQIFFAVARDGRLGRTRRRPCPRRVPGGGLPGARGGGLAVAEVARHHDVDSRELYRSVRRHAGAQPAGQSGDCRPRWAGRCCGWRRPSWALGDVDAAEHDAVHSWLRGELRSVTALRSALIYARIGQAQRARDVRLDGGAAARGRAGGLVLQLNLDRLAEARRPPAEARYGYYYSKAAVAGRLRGAAAVHRRDG